LIGPKLAVAYFFKLGLSTESAEMTDSCRLFQIGLFTTRVVNEYFRKS